MATDNATSKGVDTLIARLREDGVAAGRAEAEALKAEARQEAAKIIAKAKAEAETHLTDARKTADAYRAAGQEALQIAMRDAVLTMKAGLMAQFEADVKRMVSSTLADPTILRQMIVELVGRARETVTPVEGTEVVLPADIVGVDAIRENPDDIRSGTLTKFVLGLTQDMLAEGVTLHAADDLQGGIRARRADGVIELDLSDEAIASLIMQHLQPRFRAVMEGVIS
ncbi:MAG: V-type ATP synthase subunit E family protein [Devosia sp.]